MLDTPQIMCNNENTKGGEQMKKNMNIVTGVIDFIIVASAFILQTWSYAKGGYMNIFSWDWGSMSTLELLGENIYFNEILLVALVGAFGALVLSGFSMFKKKKINQMKIVQGIASIVVVCTYIAVHLGVFEFISDYSICELNSTGLVVVIICIVNAVLSFALVKESDVISQPQVNENTIAE